MTGSVEVVLARRVFVVRKSHVYIVITIVLVLLSASAMAADYTEGCCISPTGLAGGLDMTEESCASPNVWLENCYDATIPDTPQFDETLFLTGCCCQGATPGFVTEATTAGKTPSDIIKKYCSAQPNYNPRGAPGNDCSMVCDERVRQTVFVEGFVNNSLGGAGLTDIDVTLERDTGDKFKTTTINGEYNFSFVETGTVRMLITVPIGYPLNCTSLSPQTETINGDEIFNYELVCTETGSGCEPEWELAGYGLVDIADLADVTEEGWSDCTVYAGSEIQRRIVTDNNECGYSPSNYGFEMTRFCGKLNLTGECGDGVVNKDLGEQCDGTTFLAANGTLITSSPTCERVLGRSYGAGTMICNPQNCTFDLSNCNPSCTGTCDNILKCGCDICKQTEAGRELCSQDCKSLAPGFVPPAEEISSRNVYDLYEAFGDVERNPGGVYPGISYELGSRDVTLNWDYTSSCNAQLLGFKLTICEEAGETQQCQSGTTKGLVIQQPSTRSDVLENVLTKEYTSYCYNVCAITENGQENCAYEPGNLPCFFSGSNICMRSTQQQDDYDCELVGNELMVTGCHFHDTFTTLTNLSLVTDSCGDGICVETDKKPGAACREVTECEQCNGLFGLYANYDLQVSIATEDYYCEDMQYKATASSGTKITKGYADVIGLCYKDETLSTQPAFDSCENVDSCYTYSSKAACENDPCMRFQDAGKGCEWSSFNDELGIGVCSPVAEEQIECGRCDTDSPLGFCTETFCQDIYGKEDNLCYYNEEELSNLDEDELRDTLYRDITTPLVPTCVRKDTMGCYYYDNEADCTGGVNASYDITYDIAESADVDTSQAEIISGSNAQLTFSNDYFGFCNCYWDANQKICVKNANNMLFHKTNGNVQDDCLEKMPFISSRFDDISCFTDTEHPHTTILWKEGNIPHYGKAELTSLPLQVTDDKQESDKIYTYFSLTRSGDTLTYPTEPFTALIDLEEGILADLSDGVYIISYFSADVAKNFEPIQQKTIRIDGTAPTAEISRAEVIPETLGQDSYVSDLLVEVAVTETAHCKLELYNSAEKLAQPSNDKELLATTGFNTRYVNLLDGRYTLKGFCSDAYGNKHPLERSVLVDGDLSIINPEPSGGLYKSGQPGEANLDDLELSVQTQNPATCYVSPTKFTSGLQGILMTPSDDATSHSIPYAEVSTSTNTGTYLYYVRCVFPTETVQNQPADTITFTIDEEPPLSILTKRQESGDFVRYEEFSENWEEIKYFRITCDDYSPKIPFASVGCSRITYCLRDTRVTGLTPSELEEYCDPAFSGSSKSFDITGSSNDLQTYGRKFLYYYATDSFGNEEPEVHVAELRIRNTNFDAPTFELS